jgi:hypothetical protein
MQLTAVFETGVEEAAVAAVVRGDAKLAEVSNGARMTVDESLTNRTGGNRRDRRCRALTRHDRLMHVAFDRTTRQRIRLAFQTDSDVAWKYGVPKQAPDFPIVLALGNRKPVAGCRRGRTNRHARRKR